MTLELGASCEALLGVTNAELDGTSLAAELASSTLLAVEPVELLTGADEEAMARETADVAPANDDAADVAEEDAWNVEPEVGREVGPCVDEEVEAADGVPRELVPITVQAPFTQEPLAHSPSSRQPRMHALSTHA